MFGFGKALDVLRDGGRVQRQSWDWADERWLTLVPAGTTDLDPHLDLRMPPCIAIVTRDGPNWLTSEPWAPTHSDLLAEDWEYVT